MYLICKLCILKIDMVLNVKQHKLIKLYSLLPSKFYVMHSLLSCNNVLLLPYSSISNAPKYQKGNSSSRFLIFLKGRWSIWNKQGTNSFFHVIKLVVILRQSKYAFNIASFFNIRCLVRRSMTPDMLLIYLCRMTSYLTHLGGNNS